MKRITLILALIGLISCQANTQKQLDQMSVKDWEEDLEYLNKKIQKQFKSFTPGLKENFGEQVKILKSQLPKLKNYQVPCEIMKLLASLKDGHTELNIAQKTVGFHRVPLVLYFFEGELFVLAAHESNADLIGGKITEIEKHSLSQAFDKLKQNMSHDNDMEYIHAGPSYIILTELLHHLGIISDPKQATLTFQLSDGKTVKKTFQALDLDTYNKGPWADYYSLNNLETRLYVSQRELRYWYKYLPESKTMYFNFTRVNNQKGRPSIKKFIAQLFEEIDQRRPNKLIIDLRLNNGGNYHKSRPLISAIKSREWLNQEGKIWVITGRRTFSAATVTSIFLKKETKAKIVGEPGRTHPNNSSNNEYMNLPNSDLLIEYTTRIKKHWPEQPDWDRIPVDIEIAPSFDAYAKGVDSALEYILKAS